MERLIKIKNKLVIIEAALDKQHPHYRADPIISELVTDLKDYVEQEQEKSEKQLKRRELSEFEKVFIAPAISDVYLQSIDKLKRNGKPSEKMANLIFDTITTIDHWLDEIESAKKQ